MTTIRASEQHNLGHPSCGGLGKPIWHISRLTSASFAFFRLHFISARQVAVKIGASQNSALRKSVIQSCNFAHGRQRFGLRWQSAAATPLSARPVASKSGVALRFPPQSKICGCGASRVRFIRVHPRLKTERLIAGGGRQHPYHAHNRAMSSRWARRRTRQPRYGE